MQRDAEARELWCATYEHLSADRPGLFGAVIARSEAHVTRLSCLYALLDASAVVQRQHLRAALAIWQYAEASARYIFGDNTGDSTADALLAALRSSGALDRTAISNLFGRNVSSGRLAQALGLLLRYGLARSYRAAADSDNGRGRDREMWEATSPGLSSCNSSSSYLDDADDDEDDDKDDADD